MSELVIRPAKREESALVLDFIKQIAHYEKLSHLVEADELLIHEALFVNHDAAAIIAFFEGTPVGFALYYYSFSTFKGRKGLYLEDLFVKEEYRHKGYGKELIFYLIKLAKAQNCGRMEWS
ncbi:MAG: GNAT family N-acetyltransferase, partial [Candidatus Izemoplasmatales bacterium]